ncbi:hypothetical protein X755_11340 [Mesorhizobium sp. LNJC405B00]|nr:hypothetical protein X755_11340 [Mesorhizobium sp. LNJC405B00]
MSLWQDPIQRRDRTEGSLLPLRYVQTSDRQRVCSSCLDALPKPELEFRNANISKVFADRAKRLLPRMRVAAQPCYDASPTEIALHVGTFDDPAHLVPRYNYGSAQRLGWVCCGIDLPDRDTEERW